MILKEPRSHTSSNAQFTSFQLVLYVIEGASRTRSDLDLAKGIEEESALDATSTRAAPGLLRLDGIRSGGRAYPTPIRVMKHGSCVPGVHAI
jgi:hypothetical protein